MSVSAEYKIDILSYEGRVVRSFQKEFGSEFIFELYDLPASVYFVKITSEGMSEYIKFIKSCR